MNTTNQIMGFCDKQLDGLLKAYLEDTTDRAALAVLHDALLDAGEDEAAQGAAVILSGGAVLAVDKTEVSSAPPHGDIDVYSPLWPPIILDNKDLSTTLAEMKERVRVQIASRGGECPGLVRYLRDISYPAVYGLSANFRRKHWRDPYNVITSLLIALRAVGAAKVSQLNVRQPLPH